MDMVPLRPEILVGLHGPTQRWTVVDTVNVKHFPELAHALDVAHGFALVLKGESQQRFSSANDIKWGSQWEENNISPVLCWVRRHVLLRMGPLSRAHKRARVRHCKLKLP